MFRYILQGFLLGIAYVAPIGTQNLFVINTALTLPRRRVLLTALIVMFFDVSLSLACFYGVGALISASVWIELLVVLIGSVVVIRIGIGLLRSRGTMESSESENMSVKKVIATACVVTWFNPQALLDGTMLFGASKASIPAEYGTAFIAGCASASVVWWIGMSMLVNLLRAKISDRLLRIVNIVCGIFIVLYGLKLLWSGVQTAMDYFG